MVMRKCPKCGTVWYSSDNCNDWTCTKCGESLPVKLNEIAK